MENAIVFISGSHKVFITCNTIKPPHYKIYFPSIPKGNLILQTFP